MFFDLSNDGEYFGYDDGNIYVSDEDDSAFRSSEAHYDNDVVRDVFNKARSRKSGIDSNKLNYRNANGNTALMLAVEKRDAMTCEFLLSLGASPDVGRSKFSKFTALSLAFNQSNSNCMKLLIENGASFSCDLGLEALQMVVRLNFFDAIILGEKKTFKGKNMAQRETALLIAFKNGQAELVEQLLKNKVSLEISLFLTNSAELVNKLIQYGVDVNISDHRGRTALHNAAESKQLDIVKLLLEANANMEAVDIAGNTPFLLLVMERNIVLRPDVILIIKRNVDSQTHLSEMITSFIERGCNINCVNKAGETPFSCAVKYGSLKTVTALHEKGANIKIDALILHDIIKKNRFDIAKYLIKIGVDVSQLNAESLSPLMLAIDKVNDDLVRLLIDAGADVNCCSQGNSALIRALSLKQETLLEETLSSQYKIVESIVQAGARVNCANNRNTPALMLALETNQINLVKALIDGQCNVKVKNDQMVTALMFAVEKQCCTEIIELLLKAGANANDQDLNGNTVLMKIVKETEKKNYVYSGAYLKTIHLSSKKVKSEIETMGLVRLLIENGAEVNTVNKANKSALNIATSRRVGDVAKFLIQNGADVNNGRTANKSPLLKAADKFSLDIIDDIVKAGADVNATDKNGNSALLKVLNRYSQMDVCWKENFLKCVTCLVEHGANLNHKNCFQQSPLSLAIKKDLIRIINYLIEKGADTNGLNELSEPMLFCTLETLDERIATMLIKGGANVNLSDTKGRNALIRMLLLGIHQHTDSVKIMSNKHLDYSVSIKAKRLTLVKVLVESGIDVNKKSDLNESALTLAVSSGDTEIVKYLIQCGASINSMGCVRKVGKKLWTEIVEVIPQSPDAQSPTAFPHKDPFLESTSHYLDIDIFYGKQTNKTKKAFTCKYNPYVNCTPIQVALLNEHLDTLKLLMNAGADIFEKDDQGDQAIHYAARCKNKRMLRYFLCSLNPNQNSNELPGKAKRRKISLDLNFGNDNGETALMIAVSQGRTLNVKMLLKAGCDVNATFANKDTVLLKALRKGFDKIAYLLVTSGAHFTIINHKGQSAFHLSVKHRCIKTLVWLIQAGANVFERTKLGGTALHLVSTVEMAKTLIKFGVSVNDTDIRGRSPLHMAVKNQNSDIVQFLLIEGAIVNAQTRAKNTALTLAAKLQNLHLIRVLLQAGADSSIQNKFGDSPLTIAAKLSKDYHPYSYGVEYSFNVHRESTFQEFLKLPFDLNKQDNLGRTALMLLIQKDSESQVMNISDLLSKGADVNIRDIKRRTALDYSLMNVSPLFEVVDILLENNVDPLLKAETRSFINTEHFFQDFCYRSNKLLRLYLSNGIVYNLLGRSPRNSTFETRLKVGDTDAVRYLLANSCLSVGDIKTCVRYTNKVSSAFRSDHHLSKACSHPWPLVKLAFITVSTILGDSPSREAKVKEIQLPESIRELFMFQSPAARIPVKEWSRIPACFDPVEYEHLPSPRPLLYYWPFGTSYY